MRYEVKLTGVRDREGFAPGRFGRVKRTHGGGQKQREKQKEKRREFQKARGDYRRPGKVTRDNDEDDIYRKLPSQLEHRGLGFVETGRRQREEEEFPVEPKLDSFVKKGELHMDTGMRLYKYLKKKHQEELGAPALPESGVPQFGAAPPPKSYEMPRQSLVPKGFGQKKFGKRREEKFKISFDTPADIMRAAVVIPLLVPFLDVPGMDKIKEALARGTRPPESVNVDGQDFISAVKNVASTLKDDNGTNEEDVMGKEKETEKQKETSGPRNINDFLKSQAGYSTEEEKGKPNNKLLANLSSVLDKPDVLHNPAVLSFLAQAQPAVIAKVKPAKPILKKLPPQVIEEIIYKAQDIAAEMEFQMEQVMQRQRELDMEIQWRMEMAIEETKQRLYGGPGLLGVCPDRRRPDQRIPRLLHVDLENDGYYDYDDYDDDDDDEFDRGRNDDLYARRFGCDEDDDFWGTLEEQGLGEGPGDFDIDPRSFHGQRDMRDQGPRGMHGPGDMPGPRHGPFDMPGPRDMPFPCDPRDMPGPPDMRGPRDMPGLPGRGFQGRMGGPEDLHDPIQFYGNLKRPHGRSLYEDMKRGVDHDRNDDDDDDEYSSFKRARGSKYEDMKKDIVIDDNIDDDDDEYSNYKRAQMKLAKKPNTDNNQGNKGETEEEALERKRALRRQRKQAKKKKRQEAKKAEEEEEDDEDEEPTHHVRSALPPQLLAGDVGGTKDANESRAHPVGPLPLLPSEQGQVSQIDPDDEDYSVYLAKTGRKKPAGMKGQKSRPGQVGGKADKNESRAHPVHPPTVPPGEQEHVSQIDPDDEDYSIYLAKTGRKKPAGPKGQQSHPSGRDSQMIDKGEKQGQAKGTDDYANDSTHKAKMGGKKPAAKKASDQGKQHHPVRSALPPQLLGSGTTGGEPNLSGDEYSVYREKMKQKEKNAAKQTSKSTEAIKGGEERKNQPQKRKANEEDEPTRPIRSAIPPQLLAAMNTQGESSKKDKSSAPKTVSTSPKASKAPEADKKKMTKQSQIAADKEEKIEVDQPSQPLSSTVKSPDADKGALKSFTIPKKQPPPKKGKKGASTPTAEGQQSQSRPIRSTLPPQLLTPENTTRSKEKQAKESQKKQTKPANKASAEAKEVKSHPIRSAIPAQLLSQSGGEASGTGSDSSGASKGTKRRSKRTK